MKIFLNIALTLIAFIAFSAFNKTFGSEDNFPSYLKDQLIDSTGQLSGDVVVSASHLSEGPILVSRMQALDSAKKIILAERYYGNAFIPLSGDFIIHYKREDSQCVWYVGAGIDAVAKNAKRMDCITNAKFENGYAITEEYYYWPFHGIQTLKKFDRHGRVSEVSTIEPRGSIEKQIAGENGFIALVETWNGGRISSRQTVSAPVEIVERKALGSKLLLTVKVNKNFWSLSPAEFRIYLIVTFKPLKILFASGSVSGEFLRSEFNGEEELNVFLRTNAGLTRESFDTFIVGDPGETPPVGDPGDTPPVADPGAMLPLGDPGDTLP